MAYLYARYLVPEFEKYFRSSLILDVGCGKGSLEAIVNTIPEKELKAEFIGVDVSLTLLSIAKNYVDHLILASANQLPFKDKVFDAVFSIEVIEHLTYKAGYSHIKDMERVSKDLIVITTPSHYFIQDMYENIPKNFMTHKSLWKADQFRRLGYIVKGLHPAREYIPQSLVKRFPYLACSIFAYKMLK